MAKGKLTADEAREFTKSLAKAAAGDWELMDIAITTLGVPEALGMSAGEWVDTLGGYTRMDVATRRAAVQQLKDSERTIEQTATILGIGMGTVQADRRYNKALEDLRKDDEPVVQQLPQHAGSSGGGSKGDDEPADSTKQKWTREDINALFDEGKSNMQAAILTGLTEDTIRLNYRKAYDNKKAGDEQKARGLTEGEAHAMLEGRLASIELGALNLAAWWRQQGKEALAEGDLAWVDETIAHTKEKVSMILDSVRGVDKDADAALARWAKEAEEA